MIQLKHISDHDFEQINQLYHRAFLKEERIEIQYLMAKQDEDTHLYGIYDDDLWVGMTYVVSYNHVNYVYYLAIDESLRGKGYGSLALQKLQTMYDSLILCIEEVDECYEDYDHRLSRMKFYFKNGFKDMDFRFVETGLRFQMLYYGNSCLPQQFYDLMYNLLGERYNKMRGLV